MFYHGTLMNMHFYIHVYILYMRTLNLSRYITVHVLYNTVIANWSNICDIDIWATSILS